MYAEGSETSEGPLKAVEAVPAIVADDRNEDDSSRSQQSE